NELKGGRAYAAYVIPEHFTADLLTITTGSFTQPKIEYYVNEKSGPVAPKITDTGATTLDETINSTFVATVSDVVVKTIDEKVNEGRESTKEMQSKAAQKISEAVAATGRCAACSPIWGMRRRQGKRLGQRRSPGVPASTRPMSP
ncbi:MAG: YhgE/Pip domain-containing protein, partial [Coriobacteriaceae bacterium]